MDHPSILLLHSTDIKFGTGDERKAVFKDMSASRPGLAYLRPGHLADESFINGFTSDVL